MVNTFWLFTSFVTVHTMTYLLCFVQTKNCFNWNSIAIVSNTQDDFFLLFLLTVPSKEFLYNIRLLWNLKLYEVVSLRRQLQSNCFLLRLTSESFFKEISFVSSFFSLVKSFSFIFFDVDTQKNKTTRNAFRMRVVTP